MLTTFWGRSIGSLFRETAAGSRSAHRADVRPRVCARDPSGCFIRAQAFPFLISGRLRFRYFFSFSFGFRGRCCVTKAKRIAALPTEPRTDGGTGAPPPSLRAVPTPGRGALGAAESRGGGDAHRARLPTVPGALSARHPLSFRRPQPSPAESQRAAPGGSFLPRIAPSGNSIARCVCGRNLWQLLRNFL